MKRIHTFMTQKASLLPICKGILLVLSILQMGYGQESTQFRPGLLKDFQGDLHSPPGIQAGFKKAIPIALTHDTFFSTSDSLEIHVFQTREKYAFIRFDAYFETKGGLYKIEGDKVIDTIFQEYWNVGYSMDTIRDVNGDHYLDVITSYYSPSGCCRRNDIYVRVYNPFTHQFEKGLSFMNPTFYPKEGIIRGVKYGHPGEVPLYKFKWNSFAIDTIEYVYPDKDRKSNFILSQRRLTYDELKNLSLLTGDPRVRIVGKLPEEYLTIEDLDWFLDY